MKASKGVAQHRAWLGAAALATLVFGLTIAGADVTKTTRTTGGAARDQAGPHGTSTSDFSERSQSSPAQDVIAGSSSVASPDSVRPRQRVVAGQMPEGELPLVARHIVDYRADEMTRARNEGRLNGPWPMTLQADVTAAGGCSFDVQCDDSNRCTIDTCNLPVGGGLGSGKCEHNPVGEGNAGGCDNGQYCDGEETCQQLVCQPPASNAGAPCDANVDCLGGLCFGTCQFGASATCCSVEGSETFCLPAFGTCSPDSDNPTDPVTGKPTPCTSDTDCRGVGRCDRCFGKCTADADCDDGRKCNGTETCDVGTGQCQRDPSPPCGLNADCDEGRCLGGATASRNRGCTTAAGCPGGLCVRKVCANNPDIACATTTDCPGNGPCVDLIGAICHVGRCCSTDLASSSGGCSKRQLAGQCSGGTNATANCKGNGLCSGGTVPGTRCSGNSDCGTGGTCVNACPGPNCDCPGGTCVKTANVTTLTPCPGGNSWYPGDSGREALATANSGSSIEDCGGQPADLSETYFCPRYSGGLTQFLPENPPSYPLTVGPVSDSAVSVPMPGGPGGPLNKLGDDYTVVDGSHIGLDVLRFIGGPITPGNRILVEFYDANSNFIEDIVLPPQPTDVGVVVVEFEPELTVPPNGFVVLRAAGNFDPDTRLVWLSTSAAAVGTNDPNVLWVNNGPAANFLAPNPGVLAFELVGDPVTAPSGACCDPTTGVGTCEDGVKPWVCTGIGRADNYNGDGSVCAQCFGGTNPGGACRKCVGGGNAGNACTGPASCPGGTCELNDATCPGSACTGPLAGNLCTTDVDCTLEGSCPSGTCVSGNVGASCTVDTDCDVPGTCGTAFCQASASCGNGACCIAGSCSVVAGPGACTGGGTFQGFGTDCDADDGLDPAQQHCCPQPGYKACLGGANDDLTCTVPGDCPSGTCSTSVCSGGPNNLDSCTTDADCRRCVGSPLGDISCTTNANCARCVGGSNPGATCSVDADCLGGGDCQGECLGTCGTRFTGADNAADAYVNVISVPGQGQQAVTVTITGNNNGATSTPQNPDSFWGPLPNVNDEPGWWEAFSVNACAWVRVDHCCTNPVHEPAWAILSLDPQGVNTIGNTPNPYHFGEVANRRGEPYCKNGDDNLWQSFGPLAAGQTYYLPIYSALAGHHGDYQVHITVENCPNAACCMGNGTCALLNQPDCDAAGGLYLGKPQIPTAVTNCGSPRCSGGPTPSQSCINVGTQDNCGTGGTCLLDSNGACATGSCCVAPGACRDNDTLGHSMTEAICDSVGFEGSFVGGVRCRGGSCDSAPSFSCSTAACTGPVTTPPSCCPLGLSDCTTDEEKDAQRNPCPICEFADDAHCQMPAGGFIRLADSTVSPPTYLVDDFTPTTTDTLRTICLLSGTYLVVTDGAITGDAHVNPAFVQSTDFTVRLFDEDPVGHVPGNLLGEWATNVIANFEDPYLLPPPIRQTLEWYDFSLELIPTGTYPLVQVQAGQTYFMQIDPATNGIEQNWFLYLIDAAGGQGNNIAYQDLCEKIEADDANAVDLAYCLSVPFDPPAEPVATCCTGSVPACLDNQTLIECLDIAGRWRPDLPDCTAGCPAEPNDICADATFVREGFFTFDLFNALQDGADMQQCEFPGVLTDVDGDIWYFYQPSVSGLAYIGTCSCERSGDEVVLIYTNPSNPSQCPCPGDAGFTMLTCQDSILENNHINPLGCAENFGDHGEVEINVTAGNCYTVRVAGFRGNAPIGDLLIAVAPGFCGDNVKQTLGGEQCDGTDSPLCPGQCSVNCQCPPPPCGNGVHEAALGEECDATAPDVGAPCSPGLCNMNPAVQAICTCIPNCGNNHREGSELCDGTDLGICPAGPCSPACRCPATCGNNVAEVGEQCDGTDDALCPTRCGQGGASPCQCPTPSCGNNFVEALGNNEECDGTDITGHGKCDPVDCRAPGDPGGECKCACPGGTIPQPPVWNNTIQRSRALQVSAPPIVTSSGAAPQIAMEVKLTDLQTPVPANPPCCPPQNFGMWESGTCTAAGESGGCSRWVGRPTVFLESQDNGLLGTLKVAKLQCSPFYHDFGAEGLFEIAGPEIMPSSTYTLKTYSADCKGAETGCAFVSADVVAGTRRSGDVTTPFAPTGTQPDPSDVVAIVNKFRNQPNSLPKAVAQIQPNYIDANIDVGALDIVATIDAFRGSAYPYSGPCACPSTVTCNATSCGACAGGGLCVKTCTGGPNAGQPCITDKHCRTCAGGSLAGAPCLTDGNCPGGTCPAVGTCPATGFCRDRCGRCKP